MIINNALLITDIAGAHISTEASWS